MKSSILIEVIFMKIFTPLFDYKRIPSREGPATWHWFVSSIICLLCVHDIVFFLQTSIDFQNNLFYCRGCFGNFFNRF